MNENKCVIILGTRRSGSSAMAGCLNLIGFNLGNALMPGNEANQSGYFENQDIVLAHDTLFRDLGCRWDMVGGLPPDWLESQAARKALDTLSNILQDQFLNQNRPFAVKDPRMCRLMPLWSRALEQFNIRPGLILVLRHPMEVAKSLQKINGHELLKGHLLWLSHNREALAGCRGQEYLMITFDQLLADPIATLRKTARLSALAGIDPLRHSREILQFVRPELKNHHQSESSEIHDGLFRHYAWVYDQFRTLQAKSQVQLTPKAAEDAGPQNSMAQEISEFPLAISVSKLLPATDERRHAAVVFDNLLSVIGRYEQAELDESNQLQRRILSATNAAETIFAQIYFPEAATGAYSERESRKVLLAPGEWQKISLEVPRPEVLRAHRLRVDPLNTRGMVNISGVKLVNPANGQECWSAQDRFAGFSSGGDALLLARGDNLVMAATGDDPRLLLPELPDLPDCPMRLEMWIKAGRGQDVMHKYWRALLQNRSQLVAKHDELQQSRQQYQVEIEKLKKQLDQTREDLNLEKAGKARLQDQMHELGEQLESNDHSRQKVKEELERTQHEIRGKDKTLEELEKQLQSQKELTREYSETLFEADKKHSEFKEEFRQKIREKDKSIIELKEKLQDRVREKDDKIEELKERFENQKSLTTQYFHALAQAEEEQEKFRAKAMELAAAHKNLRKDFETIFRSRRWKISSALARITGKPRKPKPVERIEKIFKKLDTQTDLSAVACSQPNDSAVMEHADSRQMVKAMERLHKDFQALLGSRRWKAGTLVVRLLGRAKNPKPVIRINEVFAEFDQWKKNTDPSFISHGEVRKLQRWMKRLHKDFQSLLGSRRWKIGNAIGKVTSLGIRRSKKPTAVDRMHDIFKKYGIGINEK
jgi:hypothetical protein